MDSSKLGYIADRCKKIRGLRVGSIFALCAQGLGVLKKEGPRQFLRYAYKYVVHGKGYFAGTGIFAYRVWMERNEIGKKEEAAKEIAAFAKRPIISVIVPVYNVDPQWLDACIQSVANQWYPHWQLCLHDDASTKQETFACLKKWETIDSRIKISYGKKNLHISGASNEALKMANGEFVALLDNDDELSPDALFEIAKTVNKHPDADFIYSDEDKLSERGERIAPFFKPDWSPDLLLSIMYTCHVSVYRKTIVDAIGGFRPGFEGSQDYDLALRFVEKTTRENIIHISKILYHWRILEGSTAKHSSRAKQYAYPIAQKAISEHLQRIGVSAQVDMLEPTGSYRVKRSMSDFPKVSIIIPFKDKVGYLKRCVKSIKEKTDYPSYEIILVDNNSEEPKTKAFLDSLADDQNIRIFVHKEAFNFSAINNAAVEKVDSPYVLFLNNDTEVINGDWLGAMMEQAVREEVGAVGAKLYYGNNTIQHAGVVMGIGGIAGHAFRHSARSKHAYFNLTHVIRNCSAVTGACLLTKKKLFEDMGGFDEKNLAIAYNDVDYCLKIVDSGKLVVFTPFAELHHYEAVSRGNDDDFKRTNPEKYQRFMAEREFMESKWKKYIAHDPYYNPNLTRTREDFTLNV